MEEHIDVINFWDYHGRRVSYNGLEIIVDAFHALDVCIFFVWYNKEDSMQCPIGCTFLQVEYYRSDGVCDFQGTHGGITAHDRRERGSVDSSNSGYTVYRLSKILYLVDQFGPVTRKCPRKRRWSA